MEWISVKERGTPGGYVLVFDGNYFGVGEFSHRENGKYFFLIGDCMKSITHWMYLPEKPDEYFLNTEIDGVLTSFLFTLTTEESVEEFFISARAKAIVQCICAARQSLESLKKKLS